MKKDYEYSIVDEASIFIDRFENDPVGFVEFKFPSIQLADWQKDILKELAWGEKVVCLPRGRRAGVTLLKRLYDAWKSSEADTKSI